MGGKGSKAKGASKEPKRSHNQSNKTVSTSTAASNLVDRVLNESIQSTVSESKKGDDEDDDDDHSLTTKTKKQEKKRKNTKTKKKSKKKKNMQKQTSVSSVQLETEKGYVTIEFTQEDEDRIDKLREESIVHDRLSRQQLLHILAGFKANKEGINKEHFRIVYDTVASTSDELETSSELAFEAFHQRHKNMAFEDFAHFLAIMVKGSAEERIQYCFVVADKSKKGYLLQDELANLLSVLPHQHMFREYHIPLGLASRTQSLNSIKEEDEETESGQDATTPSDQEKQMLAHKQESQDLLLQMYRKSRHLDEDLDVMAMGEEEKKTTSEHQHVSASDSHQQRLQLLAAAMLDAIKKDRITKQELIGLISSNLSS